MTRTMTNKPKRRTHTEKSRGVRQTLRNAGPGLRRRIHQTRPAPTLTDYDIREVNDSGLALEPAREFRPDLILLDVMMPRLDGEDIAAQIRADEKLEKVPIVYLTAMVNRMETAARPNFGGFPFIARPVTPERMAESLDKHLDR